MMRSKIKLVFAAVRGMPWEEVTTLGSLAAAVVTGVWPFLWPTSWWGTLLILGLSIFGGAFALIRLATAFHRSLKFVREKHVPVIVVLGRGNTDLQTVVAEALQVMHGYGFDEDVYRRDYDLTRESFVMHHADALPPDPEQWKRLVLRARRLVLDLNNRLRGRRVFHVFLVGPIGFAIGLGAALGTKHEVVFHHHQPAAGPTPYHPVLTLTGEMLSTEGAHGLKTRLTGDLPHLRIRGLDQAAGVVYVALGLAGHHPTPVADLAVQAGATFVGITSTHEGTIPVDTDWLLVAREVNTVVLSLLAKPEVQEIHLFPALPLPIGFALGMGVDTRSAVRVHQWAQRDQKYDLVLRLNELRDWLFA